MGRPTRIFFCAPGSPAGTLRLKQRRALMQWLSRNGTPVRLLRSALPYARFPKCPLTSAPATYRCDLITPAIDCYDPRSFVSGMFGFGLILKSVLESPRAKPIWSSRTTSRHNNLPKNGVCLQRRSARYLKPSRVYSRYLHAIQEKSAAISV